MVESALELIPPELWGHPEVRRDARSRGLNPGEVVLDRSYHHRAMLRLKDGERRGRPDIVHFALLSALETPLGMVDRLRVHVHTINDLVLEVAPETRLPRSYPRFKGLIEQALTKGRVPVGEETKPLITVKEQGIAGLITELSPFKVVGLSRLGKLFSLRRIAESMAHLDGVAILVGGFPRGHFRDETRSLLNELYAIDPAPLEAWVVTARLIYAFEQAQGLEDERTTGTRERSETPTF